MPDVLDLSHPIEAPLPIPVHVGRFRVDAGGRWVWSGAAAARSDALAGMSQAANRKLRDVAAELVSAWSTDAPLSPATARALATELDQLRRRDAASGEPRRPT